MVLGLPAILAACERGSRQRQAARHDTGGTRDTRGTGGTGGAGDTAQNGFRNLSADEAAELQAIAARIMPNDDGTAGAEEAGVIYFMDNVLTEPEQLALLRDGLSDLQQRVQTRYGGNAANGTPNNGNGSGSGTPSATAFHRLPSPIRRWRSDEPTLYASMHGPHRPRLSFMRYILCSLMISFFGPSGGRSSRLGFGACPALPCDFSAGLFISFLLMDGWWGNNCIRTKSVSTAGTV